jgi:hypothetical protein
LLGAAGCGDGTEEAANEEHPAYVDQVEVDPRRIRVSPDPVQPGGELLVEFPEADSRGPGFVVERKSRDAWEWVWAVSHEPADPEPRLWSAAQFEDQGVEWDSGPAIDSFEPHRVPVPANARPGDYRVCTAPDEPALCAEFRVAPSEG